ITGSDIRLRSMRSNGSISSSLKRTARLYNTIASSWYAQSDASSAFFRIADFASTCSINLPSLLIWFCQYRFLLPDILPNHSFVLDNVCLTHCNVVSVAQKENSVFRDYFPDCPRSGTAKGAAKITFFDWLFTHFHFLFFPVPRDTFDIPSHLKIFCIHRS